VNSAAATKAASPFALSTAFKRVRDVSPRQRRVAALAK
jgi:hypothetical protein